MDKTRLSSQPRDPLPPRRVASIRRLMLIGIGLFALVAISDYFILARYAGLTLLLRIGLIALMLGLWGLAGRRRGASSKTLATWAYLQLLLVSVGTSLGLHFDPSRVAALLDTMMLVIVASGPAWPNLRYFVGSVLVCLVPMLVALAAADLGAAQWYHCALYLGASVLAAFALWRQRLHAAQASARLRVELQRIAVEDALTGVLNRSGWNQQAPAALAAAEVDNLPLSLLYLDLDHFKSINDCHGHAIGDAVIEHAARLIRLQVRQHDLVARLGGEEFVVLMVDIGLEQARVVAERIRLDFDGDQGPVPSSLCVGVAERRRGEDLATLTARADAALLRAKRNGRNRVEHADEPALDWAS